MDLESPSQIFGYMLAAVIAIEVGGELAAAKLSAILDVLSGVPGKIGAAVGGDPAAQIHIIVLVWVAVVLFIVIPGKLGLFRLLAPE